MSINKPASIGGLMAQRDPGKHVEAIRLEEGIDKMIAYNFNELTLEQFVNVGRAIWYGEAGVEYLNASAQLDRLKPIVEDLLVKAGWEVHIVDHLKREKTVDYIHAAGLGLMVHEVAFSAEWNTDLRLDELCNPDGSIRSKEETLALLKKRIGIDTYDISELSEEDRSYVLAIMQREERDLENLHNVNEQELTTGAQSFRWFRDDEEAEQEARDYLTDSDDLWKEAVAAGNTTDGLDEWAEDVLKMDGWAQIIGGYDGYERVAQLKDGAWFPYIRTN